VGFSPCEFFERQIIAFFRNLFSRALPIRPFSAACLAAP
jgi:hypothetical protein